MGIYDRHAVWYDAIYDASGQDPASDVRILFALLAARGIEPRSMLDVACGTGRHALAFQAAGIEEVTGVDRSEAMLRVARERAPDVDLAEADFRTFDLGRTFDLVTCLFSSIGHVADRDELGQALGAMAGHVAPGGALVVETWLTPEMVDPDGRRDAATVEVPGGYVSRLGRSVLDGDALVVEFAWAVATRDGIDSDVERHRMPLFTGDDHLAALEGTGLAGEWIAPGPLTTGRPLLVGRRP